MLQITYIVSVYSNYPISTRPSRTVTPSTHNFTTAATTPAELLCRQNESTRARLCVWCTHKTRHHATTPHTPSLILRPNDLVHARVAELWRTIVFHTHTHTHSSSFKSPHASFYARQSIALHPFASSSLSLYLCARLMRARSNKQHQSGTVALSHLAYAERSCMWHFLPAPAPHMWCGAV